MAHRARDNRTTARAHGEVIHAVGRSVGETAAALPDLISDGHTSIAAGRDVAELLNLVVLLHTQAPARGYG
ncbi:MAG: hypothetical protein ACRDRU_21925 [Pseudonocardiaceae bacterium]